METVTDFIFLGSKIIAAAAAKSLQSCPTLCDPIDINPPGSPAPGILQARTLEWVAISFFNAWKWKWSHSVVSNSSDPMDCSPPGSSIHGIFQARVLEWGAIAFSAKIIADGDYSHEIKRWLLLGRNAMTNLDSISKSRDITLPTKVCLVKVMVFPGVISNSI